MKEYLLVGFGGMIGSMLRYGCGSYFSQIAQSAKFPWGTFFVNIIGCLLIGVFAGFAQKLTLYNSEFRLLLIAGFLGGFTTFSAFGIESLYLLRAGHHFILFLYIISSVGLGILVAYLGLKIFA